MMDLSKRDKIMLLAGGVVLVFIGILQFVWFPTVDRLDNLKRLYAVQDETIARMTRLSGSYLATTRKLSQQAEFLKKRPSNFTLFSFLDTLAEKSGVKKNVAYMKPFTQDLDNKEFKLSKVKVKLDRVYLKGLIEFLSLIESSENGVYITSLSLNRTGKKQDRIDAVLDTQTLIKKEMDK